MFLVLIEGCMFLILLRCKGRREVKLYFLGFVSISAEEKEGKLSVARSL